MGGAPWGERREEDLPLFVRPSSDPLIEPDRVGPAVEGYFRVPAIWVGETPDAREVSVLNPAVHHAIVVGKQLTCGIKAYARRDGTFLFDFSEWALAPIVVIPGYRKPAGGGGYRPPMIHQNAEQQAEHNAIIRAQVMNVHQVCFSTAERQVTGVHAMMGFPVTAWSAHKSLSATGVKDYYDDVEDLLALARNSLNNKDGVHRQHPLHRRTIEISVVERSFELLDNILAEGDLENVRLVEGGYMAACRQRDKRSGEAVVLAWTVCEQLIALLWKRTLDALKVSGGADRMPKERREKLLGRDYTASVMVESLEITGRIDRELYRSLEVVRKARNKWAHEMRTPKEQEIYFSIRSVEALLLLVKNVPVSLQSGGRGGVPQWPIWMWNEVKGAVG